MHSKKIVTALVLAIGMAVPAVAQENDAAREQQVIDRVKKMFSRLDTDRDGLIARSEFKGRDAAFDRYDLDYDNSLHPHEVERAMLNPVKRHDRVDAMDKNADGAVTPEEFTGSEESFKRLDRNADGVISNDDLHGPSKIDPRAAASRFKTMDLDKDGRLSRDEFRGTAVTFAEQDADADGYLTLEETTAERKSGPKTE